MGLGLPGGLNSRIANEDSADGAGVKGRWLVAMFLADSAALDCKRIANCADGKSRRRRFASVVVQRRPVADGSRSPSTSREVRSPEFASAYRPPRLICCIASGERVRERSGGLFVRVDSWDDPAETRRFVSTSRQACRTLWRTLQRGRSHRSSLPSSQQQHRTRKRRRPPETKSRLCLMAASWHATSLSSAR